MHHAPCVELVVVLCCASSQGVSAQDAVRNASEAIAADSRRVEGQDPPRPEWTLDLAARGEPISPLVYGQFIEHLGRCIYGGIWAEMLEDRKFFYWVGAPESPWRRIGEEKDGSIEMDVDVAFAGHPSVCIDVAQDAHQSVGIAQRALGVFAGNHYVGHLVARGQGRLEVALQCGGKRHVHSLDLAQDSFTEFDFRLEAPESNDDAALLIRAMAGSRVHVGCASLMPRDHVNGMRADTLGLLEELSAPIYRWPGGNFVSGYDFRDGLGPRDLRPTRKNPAWKGIDSNDFGLHEFTAFCRAVDAEPLVVVNTGLGSPRLSAALVEYCNGTASTAYGARRARNGSVEPFAVRWFGVGNEMYGGWQLGHVGLDGYLVRHRQHVSAMRAVDPGLLSIGVGDSGPWSEGMLANCADSLTLLSEHFYCQEREDVAAHVAQIPEAVRRKVEQHRKYLSNTPALAQRPVKIALDEWNYWYGPEPYGELGVQYRWKDALGIARGLHEIYRGADVIGMANYAQTVNVIGCIKTSKTAAVFDTTALPLVLYRREFGDRAVPVAGPHDLCDVSAAWRSATEIALAVVNPNSSEQTLKIQVRGGTLAGTAMHHQIRASDPHAFNAPGQLQQVAIEPAQREAFDASALRVEALSIHLFVVEVAAERSATAEPIRAVPAADVQIRDRFWAPRLAVNTEHTLPYLLKMCEESGRVHNFELAGGSATGEQRGDFPFDDSDLYKSIEAVSWSLATRPDARLDQALDRLIALIAAAQEDDGYLYTARTNHAQRLSNWFGSERYEREQGSHELYNAGHLIEAAVAHHRATGKHDLLEVGLRCADHLEATFGPGLRALPPGHPVLEMALCALADLTGERRYAHLAEFFLEQRGRHEQRPDWGEYCQDHRPVVVQREAVGHAVRAGYLYAGMADVVRWLGRPDYRVTLEALWNDVVAHKWYVTGGIGARGGGEAFGAAYELPNLSAYCETCAQIAFAFWNQRMFRLEGSGKYVDALERTLYNGLISGVALDGRSFFYPNPLLSLGNHDRSGWFSCACCPPNVGRFLARLPESVYAVCGNQLFVQMYVASDARIEIGPRVLSLRQDTDYPWDGAIRINCRGVETAGSAASSAAPTGPSKEAEITVALRIPGWARGEAVPSELYRFAASTPPRPFLRVNGSGVPVEVEDGYVRLRRDWKPGDVIELNLPMPVQRVFAHSEVDEDRGRVALQRGPIVYCIEGVDHPGTHLHSLVLEEDAPLQVESQPEHLGGMVVLTAPARSARRDATGRKYLADELVALRAVPYGVWCNRGRTDMAVWIARDADHARPAPEPSLARSAKVLASHNERLAGALSDQWEPARSFDNGVPFFHWWPKFGSVEWVEYRFERPSAVSSCDVYWFRDVPQGGCDLPASWRILYRDGEEWQPVRTAGDYPVVADQTLRVDFETVTTSALRLQVQLKDGVSAGLHEWFVR